MMKARNGAVLKALYVFFFPWTREAGEEEDFSSFLCHRHQRQKDADHFKMLVLEFLQFFHIVLCIFCLMSGSIFIS